MERDLGFEVDGSGYMFVPRVHDGVILGLRSAKTSVTISIETEAGDGYEMALTDVEAFEANDYRLGNIILDVHVVTRQTPDSADLFELSSPPHPSAAQQYHDAHCGYVSQLAQKIESGQMTMVIVRSSYGCHLMALCGSISVSPVSQA